MNVQLTPRDMVIRLYLARAAVEFHGTRRLTGIATNNTPMVLEAQQRQEEAKEAIPYWRERIAKRYAEEAVL